MPPQPPLRFPSTINFPTLLPGESATREADGLLKHNGSVSVRMEGDGSNVFTVRRVKSLELVQDPELPAHHARVWEAVAEQNGGGPITVDSDQALAVIVEFACPMHPKQAKFSGTAIVHSNDATSTTILEIPIVGSVSAGAVEMKLISAPPIKPGNIATFAFRLVSTLPIEAGGVLTCDEPNSPFSNDTNPQFPIVEPGGSVDVRLEIRCAPGTPVGNYPVRFHFKPIGTAGEWAALVVPIRVHEDRLVVVNSSLGLSDVIVAQGDSFLCEFRATATGGPTTFNFEAVSVPRGIRLSETKHSAAIDRATFFGIEIEVTPDAPTGRSDPPLIFAWSVPGDEFHAPVSGQLVISNIQVVAGIQEIIYDSGQAEALTVRGWAQLAIHRNGDWFFRGHVHENGVVGNNYTFAAALRPVEASGDLLYVANSGTLGGTVDPFDDRNDDWNNLSGNDPRITQDWNTIVQRGSSAFTFVLHAATAPFQVFEAIAEILVAGGLVVAVGAVVSFLAAPGTTCSNVEWGPSPGDGVEGAHQTGIGVAAKVRCEG